MTHGTRRTLFAASALVLLAASAASGREQERECRPPDVSRKLVLSDTSVGRDQPVRMELRVKNTSGESCEMAFPSGRGGTVQVFRGGEKVWEHGYCRVYPQHIVFATWEPGHHENYRYRWKQSENARGPDGQIDCDGERTRAKPGSYSARGVFFGTEPDAKTERVDFRITG